MKLYAQIVDEKTKKLAVGLGTNSAFYKSVGMVEMEVEQAYDGQWYVKGYAPLQPLDQLKEEMVAAFKKFRNAEEVAPIGWNGSLYDYDSNSRERMRIKRQDIEDKGGTEKILWTLANNEKTEIGLDDFKGINSVAAERSEALHDKYNSLKAKVEAATSKEELENLVW